MSLLPVLRRFLRFSLLYFFPHSVCSPVLHAQADATAEKNAALSVFGAYSLVYTDRQSSRNNGVTFGGDISGYLPGGFIPSLEGRVQISPGPIVGQNTYGGGIRIDRRIHRLVPYIDFLVSYGSLTFTHPILDYKHDNSTVYTGGGGLEYNLTSQWATRVDYQFEHWDIGRHNGGLGGSFAPRILSLGIVYRIPFRPRKPG